MPTTAEAAAAGGGASKFSAGTQRLLAARELYVSAANKEADARGRVHATQAALRKARRERDRAAATFLTTGADDTSAAHFEKIDNEYQRLDQEAHDATLHFAGLPQAAFALKRALSSALIALLELVGDRRVHGDRTAARAEIIAARRALSGRADA